MTTYKGAFSFRNDNIRETPLADGVTLRIEKIGPAIAKVYFVDNAFTEIPIPQGLQIHDVSNNVAVLPVRQLQFFVLAWTDNYNIIFNGDIIIELATHRQWSLRGPPDRSVMTTEF